MRYLLPRQHQNDSRFSAKLLAVVGILSCCVGAFAYPGHAEGTSLNLGSKFSQRINNSVSDILSDVVDIPKEYHLNDADLVAPKPRQECFGETSDPAEMEQILQKAQTLLDGQSTLFTPQTPIKEETTVRYYLDDTILAITWKQVIENAVYTFSEVKIAHPSQFRRFFSGGTYGSASLCIATEMAKSVNAVAASSADYYAYRPYGITVNNGIVYRLDEEGILDTCFIDDQGDLLFVPRGELITKSQVEQYIQENNVRFSLAFGPIIIQDGEQCTPPVYTVGEIWGTLSRAALCQMDQLHYVTVSTNMEPYATNMPTLKQFATRLQELGIPKAYSLDGGQTATIVMNNTLINSVDYGDQRDISDIIYFATAMPEVD